MSTDSGIASSIKELSDIVKKLIATKNGTNFRPVNGLLLISKEIQTNGIMQSIKLLNSSPEYDQNSFFHVGSGIILKALYFLSFDEELIME